MEPNRILASQTLLHIVKFISIKSPEMVTATAFALTLILIASFPALSTVILDL